MDETYIFQIIFPPASQLLPFFVGPRFLGTLVGGDLEEALGAAIGRAP